MKQIMLKTYIPTCLIILILGCTVKKGDIITMDTLNIPPEQQISHITFSELFTNVEIIPLETSDFCLIGHINKIIPKNDLFYIHDNIAKCVFVFNRQGKFLSKIGTVGRGPGEYIDLNNIYIDDQQKKLIFDCFHKYMIYDLQTNDLILERKYALPGYEQRMYLGNEMFATYCDNFIDGNRKNNLIIEQKGQLIDSYFPIDKDMQGYTYRNEHVFFENFDRKKYFVAPYNDTIFMLNKEIVEPYLYIDYGENKLPKNFFHNIPNDQKTTQLLRSPYCHSLDNFIDNEKYTYFRYCARGRSILNFLLIKKKNKAHIFSHVKADSNGYCPILVYNVFDAGNSLIVPSEIGQLKNFLFSINKEVKTVSTTKNIVNKSIESNIYEKLEQYSENEDNNPILFVLHLK